MDELADKIADALEKANINFDRQHEVFWIDMPDGTTYSFAITECQN